MNPPTPNDFFDFLCAYFGERVEETRQESSHFVVVVSGLPDNLSIPTNLASIPERIFSQLLRSCGIPKDEYEKLAGDKRKLKAYCKRRRKAAGGGVKRP